MMYITDAYFAKELMKYMNRDKFSIDALKHILEFYDEIDEPVEFDPVGICCYWAEYAPEEVYRIWKEYIKDGMSDDQILEALNDKLYAVKLENGNFLILE